MNSDAQPNPRKELEVEIKKQDFLQQINAAEKDIIPYVERQIPQQGLSQTRNTQLELLGFQDGIANLKVQKEYWGSYAYQKGYITGTNRFWHKKFGYLTQEAEGL